jgi:hypothetical protein
MTKTHNWRPYVWAGSGLCVLATGLMIPARHSTFSDAFIVIVQVLFGSADALMHYPMMVAVQASVPPEGNYTLEYACLLNRENEN